MRWRAFVFVIGFIVAALGLYYSLAGSDWALGSLLMVVGLAGMAAGVLGRRSVK